MGKKGVVKPSYFVVALFEKFLEYHKQNSKLTAFIGKLLILLLTSLALSYPDQAASESRD
jgi:hypothetical protein